MPPITRTAPIIGTLGRRRRPVRSIRFARDAPRTPPQSPGEGRLPPVRVRLRSRQKPEHVASPLVSILRKSRSDGSLSGFRSEPLESLTLRSFAIGSFSRRSIAYFCAPATLSPFQWRALSSFRAQRWRHVTSADASISRGFGTPNNLSPATREGPPRGACAGCQNCLPSSGFCGRQNRPGRVYYLWQTP